MAFSFKGRWAFFAVVIIVLVVAVALLVSNPSLKPPKLNHANQPVQTPIENNGSAGTVESNGTAGTNQTRFVDTISKISTQRNRELIQQSLDETNYTLINAKLTPGSDPDAILSHFSQEEFQLMGISQLSPKIIGGNATASALLKLENNPNVTRIYFVAPGGGSALQDSVPLINASVVWNVVKDSLNLTGQNVAVCIVDTGVNYTHPDLGGCPHTQGVFI